MVMRTIKRQQKIIVICVCFTALLLFAYIRKIENHLKILQSYVLWEMKHSCNNNIKSLVDLKNFEYVMNNASICESSKNRSYPSIVMMVHTARSHFTRRNAIRNTWGSIKLFKEWNLHLIFLLGIDSKSPSKFEAQLLNEQKLHGDMIMGNFLDTYRNLTYKHLMGYKWVNKFCPTASYILKSDDDMFVDVFKVVEIVVAQLVRTQRSYACLEIDSVTVNRDPDYKWFIPKEQYPDDQYPNYCSGSSYVVNVNDAAKIYSVSSHTNFLWVDDVYVTGILREKYNVLIKYTYHRSIELLSLSTQYHLGNKNEIISWCSKVSDATQLNFIFILLNDKNFDLTRDMLCIWNKIRNVSYDKNDVAQLN